MEYPVEVNYMTEDLIKIPEDYVEMTYTDSCEDGAGHARMTTPDQITIGLTAVGLIGGGIGIYWLCNRGGGNAAVPEADIAGAGAQGAQLQLAVPTNKREVQEGMKKIMDYHLQQHPGEEKGAKIAAKMFKNKYINVYNGK